MAFERMTTTSSIKTKDITIFDDAVPVLHIIVTNVPKDHIYKIITFKMITS